MTAGVARSRRWRLLYRNAPQDTVSEAVWVDWFFDESAPGAYTGEGAITLSSIVASGSGDHGVAGAGAVTLATIAVAGSGAHGVAGSGAIALGGVAVSSVGAHGVSGTGAVSLGPLAVSGQVAHGVAGSGAIELGGVALAGDGAHFETVEGAGEITLGSIIVAGVDATATDDDWRPNSDGSSAGFYIPLPFNEPPLAPVVSAAEREDQEIAVILSTLIAIGVLHEAR